MKRIFYTLFLFFTGSAAALAQLDPAFGPDGNGKVTTNFVWGGGSTDYGLAMALQPDGKIIVAGGTPAKLARYTADGVLDPGFGNEGKVTVTAFADAASSEITDIELMPDGSILATGFIDDFENNQHTYPVFLIKYRPDGSPDPTFSEDGVYFPNEPYISPSDLNIGLKEDGTILLSRSISPDVPHVGNYFSELSIVSAYGIKTVRSYLNYINIQDMIIAPETGEIYFCGKSYGGTINNVSNYDFAIAKLSADLVPDGTTVPDGLFQKDISDNDNFLALALQADGKIVAGGNAGSQYLIARLTTEGILDEEFGNNGIVQNGFGGFAGDINRITSIVVQPDGKVLVAGFRIGGTLDRNWSIARYQANGQLDPCFGVSGNLEVDFSGANAVCNSVAIQADDKILMAGWVFSSTSERDFALARYISPIPSTWYRDIDDDGYGDDNNTVVSCTDPSTGAVPCPLINDPACDLTNPPCNLIPDPACIPTPAVKYVTTGGDCDDNDAGVNPGAAEVCDNKDNDCNGQTDEGVAAQTWYKDADLDGFGDNNQSIVSCTDPSTPDIVCDPIIDPGCVSTSGTKYVTTGGDCNDNDAAIKPDATEVCDGKDNDCDGQTDEGLPTTTYYTDADGDGYGAGAGIEYCSNPGAGYTTQAGDCNDNNAGVHPGAGGGIELCDGLDNDCDGLIDEGCSGKPTVSISDVTVHESEGNAVLTLKLSYITSLQVKVVYSTFNGTAVSTKKEKDYKSMGNTTLTIPPGTLTTTITVPVYNDGKVENNEYFYVNLKKPTNCLLGDVSGMVTILDGAPVTAARGSNNTEAVNLVKGEATEQFEVNAYPNPSASEFSLQVSSSDIATPVQLRVLNATGQQLKQLRGTVGKNIVFGRELKAGFYLVEVTQGANRKMVKLIKQ